MDDFDPYCKTCGGCGFIGCCGIAGFLEKHVAGKTNCEHESMFIFEILEIVNDTLPDEMKLTTKQIEKISSVKVVKNSKGDKNV